MRLQESHRTIILIEREDYNERNERDKERERIILDHKTKRKEGG